MKPGLLDVNVLIALFDPAHPHHDDAHEWFRRNQRLGWATAPLTISGCVRVLSNPAYPSFRARPQEVIDHLRQLCQNRFHRFWSDSISLLDPDTFRPELIGGHQKITDLCLVALACRNGGRLVTFDRSISLKAVVGAVPENIEVIAGRPRI